MSATPDALLERLRAVESRITSGDLDAAGAEMNQLLAAAPDDPRVYFSGAMLARKTANVQQELALLTRATRVAPRWWPAFSELAKALSRHGQHAQALAAAERAVEFAPNEIGACETAVAVANAAGDAQSAHRHLLHALELRPDDVEIHRALGVCLDNLRRHAESEAHWRAVVEQKPDDAQALGWLGMCLVALERKDEASRVLERALELAPDPAVEFFLAVARGKTPAQPPSMVAKLFDDYAARFDQHLEGVLKYRTPLRVAEIIRTRHPDLDLSVLDLGCGTGLLGKYLGPIKRTFAGVDLSRKMLEQAMKVGVYTRLSVNDIVAEMQLLRPSSFDVVTACDVFIYVGDLRETLHACHEVLRPSGMLVFSCETALESEGPLVLRPSRRFAHSQQAVVSQLEQAAFRVHSIESVDLRSDGSVDGVIAGFLVIAEK